MKQTGIILILTLASLFIAGCTNEIANSRPENITLNMNLNTDKELYHSNEVMKIKLDFRSSEDMGTAAVNVYGIYAARNRMDLSGNVNIISGDNEVYFEFTTPSCNSCSGISPGNYTITAEIIKDRIIIAKAEKIIEVQQ